MFILMPFLAGLTVGVLLVLLLAAGLGGSGQPARSHAHTGAGRTVRAITARIEHERKQIGYPPTSRSVARAASAASTLR